MSTKVRQVKSGMLYLGATVIDSVVPFLTLPVFSRILSVEDYGVLALAQVYAVVAAGVANFGLNTAFNRNYFEVCEDKKKTGELFFTTISFMSFVSFVLGMVTYILKDHLSLWVVRNPQFGMLIFLSYINVCLVNLRVFFLVYLRNVERPKQYVMNTMLLSSLNLIIPIYCVAILRWGVTGVILGQVLAAGIVLSGLFFQLIRELPFGLSPKMLKEVLAIGGPTVPMVFFGFLSNHFDKVMVGMLSTVGGVGVYSVGQKIAMLIHTFMTSLQNVFSPRIFQKMFEGKETSRSEIGQYLLPFFYLVAGIALFLILFAEEALRLCVPKTFYGAADMIMILSLFYVVLFFAKVNADQLVYAKKTSLITVLIIAAGLLNVLMCIPMIKQWGAMGAAFATFLSRALTGVLIFIVAQKYYRILWPARVYLTLFGVLCVSSFVLMTLRYFEVSYGLRLLFKCLSLGVFVGVGIQAKLLNREYIQIVFDIFNKRN